MYLKPTVSHKKRAMYVREPAKLITYFWLLFLFK